MRASLFSLVVVVALPLSGCELAGAVADALLWGRTGPRELTDEDAFAHLRRDRTAAPASGAAAAMRVIDAEATGEAPPDDDREVVDLLRRVTHSRLTIREDEFQRIDFDRFKAGGDCDYSVDLGSLYDEYLIPQVEKLPVRDQAGRGTCAAFAGVGALEYAALHPTEGNPALPTLDLSEQRFYYLSKSECHGPSGCECPGCEEGSWYGYGFDASAGAAEPDVPLETDCPYSRNQGDNDTQYPQRGSCDDGAVKVEQVGTWCGIEELVEQLHAGRAVPFASKLSLNWERNDGLITEADYIGQGATVHAGGHAYLVVGYRKLPSKPEEGGVCFVIKNSWGTGWGVEGYSCMTLAWMQAVDFGNWFGSPQPLPVGVTLRDDLRQADALPDDNEQAEDETEPDVPPEPEPEDDEELLPPEPPPEPEPEPAPVVDEYVPMRLYGPNGSYFKVRVLATDSDVAIAGVVRDRDSSQVLSLERRGFDLLHDDDVVGHIAADELRVCSAEWAHICSLRYREQDGLLYLQFRDDDLRAVKPDETSDDRGEWYGLGLGEAAYAVFFPADPESADFLLDPKLYLRLGFGEPVRLSLRPGEEVGAMDIRAQGQSVGLLDIVDPTATSVCGGAFAGACSLVGRERLYVVPRNGRER